MDQDNKTTRKCYTALIWLMTGSQVARREEHYLYELHGCFVSVATRLLTTEHDIVRSIARRKVRVRDDDQDVVYNRT